MPDACLERRTVFQLNFLGTRLSSFRVECVLYLVDDRFISNGGTLCIGSPLALLILEHLNYPISLGHFLEVSSKDGVSEEQFLEKLFGGVRTNRS